MPNEKQAAKPAQICELAFGSRSYIDQLGSRLRQHFSATDSTSPTRHDALVIGLFGEWGSGKSLWLQHLREEFEPKIDAATATKALTVPVFFNAWRFEAEEHLIIPLLKTTQHTLQSIPAPEEPKAKKAWQWIKKRTKLTAQSALAVAAGLKLSFDLPGIKANLDFDKMMKDEKERWKKIEEDEAASKDDPFDSFGDLASLYYDFQHTMQRLTGRTDNGDDEPQLNLLFLIDDLDRCLPEKAVQMLEAIKLFLDVPGCAFVLALDDEVVERGIAHRYRDYLQNNGREMDAVAHSLNPKHFEDFRNRQQAAPQAPITGAEYLEKIVQIPLRIPPLRSTDITAFLSEHYPDLFAKPPKPEHAKNTDHDDEGDDEETEHTHSQHEELLDLFRRAVPANPRKLIRSAELLSLQLSVASARGWPGIDRLTLARLVLLQLFAPEVYRFCQRQPYYTFLTQMECWQREGLFVGRGRLEKWLDQKEKEERDKLEEHDKLNLQQRDFADAQDEKVENSNPVSTELIDIETLMRPLVDRLRDCQHQRSNFDPVKLIDPSHPSDNGLRHYFDLLDKEQHKTVHADLELQWSIEGTLSTEPAKLDNPSRFVSLAAATNPLLWREATEAEESTLAGRRIPDDIFRQLLEMLQPFPPEELLSWIEHFFDHLSAGQMEQLYKETGLLAQINNGIKQEAEV